MKIHSRKLALSVAVLSALSPQLPALAQGSLTPPGAPAPTMRTLDQLDAKLEKRTPISSLPFLINTPGSYYVASNLNETAGGNGISVIVNGVTVDLNGFTLTGTNTSGRGVNLAVVNVTNVTILNGVIRNWPGGGVYGSTSSYHCRFEDLQISGCGESLSAGLSCLVRNCIVSGAQNSGILVDDGSRVVNCLSRSNANFGISGGTACQIENCVARMNGNGGLNIGSHGQLRNCVADLNHATGINAGDYSLIDGCQSVSNTGNGFVLASQSRILNSLACSNSAINIFLGSGSSAEGCISALSLTGFSVRDAATVSGCTAISNSVSGFTLFNGARAINCLVRGTGSGSSSIGIGMAASNTNIVVDGCQVIDTGTGISATAGNLIIRNQARANGVNYSIPVTCMSGPIISFGSGALVATGIITNSNPWANFSY